MAEGDANQYAVAFGALSLILFTSQFPKFIHQISVTLSKYLIRESTEEIRLKAEVVELKKHLKTIHIVDEYAKYAKTERKINKCCQDLKPFHHSRKNAAANVSLALTVGQYIFKGICMLFLVISYRRTPILIYPSYWFFPYPATQLIAMPTGISGGVGIMFWLMMCGIVVEKGQRLLSVQ